MPEPIGQFCAVSVPENTVQRVFAARSSYAVPDRQQVQIVVSQQGLRGIAEYHQVL